VFGVWRVADARVDSRAVVEDSAGVGEGLEAPLPVILAHPGVADSAFLITAPVGIALGLDKETPGS
jgi:hypothetical protein